MYSVPTGIMSVDYSCIYVVSKFYVSKCAFFESSYEISLWTSLDIMAPPHPLPVQINPLWK
jgi:hypothetical protein